MHYSLVGHHFAAIHSRDLVLLDARKGEYSLIAGAGDHIALSGAELEIGALDLAETLLASGVISSAATQRSLEVTDAPTRSALDDDTVRDGGLSWPSALAASLEMPVLYHAGAFPKLIAHVRRSRTNDFEPNHSDARLFGISATFDRLSPWAPMPGECLFRCFMLLRILARCGYAPRWVFGVRTWPFAAHCWLQAGPVVLTDYADTLRDYTPIMVI